MNRSRQSNKQFSTPYIRKSGNPWLEKLYGRLGQLFLRLLLGYTDRGSSSYRQDQQSKEYL